MTLVWMLFVFLLSSCLAGAAWFAEQALRADDRPVRWPWAAALVLTILAPVALYVAASVGVIGPGEGAAEFSVNAVGAGEGMANGIIGSAAETLASYQSGEPILGHFNRILAIAWLVLSGAVALRFGAAVWTLRRSIRDGTTASYDGEQLHFTTETGPAVVGLFQPRIVVPAWFGSLERHHREMVIRHEREHARTRDPLLLVIAQAALIAVPWNPVLWWVARRLGHAIELDCDRRVLRAGTDPADYGELLVSAKGDELRSPMIAAFGRSDSLLKRRVQQVIDENQPGSNASMAATAGLAVVLLTSGMGISHLFAQSDAVQAGLGVDIENQASSPSQTAGSELPGVARDSPADEACTENCTVEVENQLEDTDIEVYVCPTKECDYLGDVSALKSKTFDLPEGEWEHVQLHIRESPTHKFINLRCAREFEDAEAHAVIRPGDPLERC